MFYLNTEITEINLAEFQKKGAQYAGETTLKNRKQKLNKKV